MSKSSVAPRVYTIEQLMALRPGFGGTDQLNISLSSEEIALLQELELYCPYKHSCQSELNNEQQELSISGDAEHFTGSQEG